MYPDRVEKVAERLARYQPSGSGGGGSDVPSALIGASSRVAGGVRSGASKSAAGDGKPGDMKDDEDSELTKACQAVVEIATEKLVGNIGQLSKKELFTA